MIDLIMILSSTRMPGVLSVYSARSLPCHIATPGEKPIGSRPAASGHWGRDGRPVRLAYKLSATNQQYFSLRTNQLPAISQQYFSFRTNQHPSLAKGTGRGSFRPDASRRAYLQPRHEASGGPCAAGNVEVKEKDRAGPEPGSSRRVGGQRRGARQVPRLPSGPRVGSRFLGCSALGQ
jgi:hypothetical protein